MITLIYILNSISKKTSLDIVFNLKSKCMILLNYGFTPIFYKTYTQESVYTQNIHLFTHHCPNPTFQ